MATFKCSDMKICHIIHSIFFFLPIYTIYQVSKAMQLSKTFYEVHWIRMKAVIIIFNVVLLAINYQVIFDTHCFATMYLHFYTDLKVFGQTADDTKATICPCCPTTKDLPCTVPSGQKCPLDAECEEEILCCGCCTNNPSECKTCEKFECTKRCPTPLPCCDCCEPVTKNCSPCDRDCTQAVCPVLA